MDQWSSSRGSEGACSEVGYDVGGCSNGMA